MIQNRHSVLFIGDLFALFLSFVIMIALRFDFRADYSVIVFQAKLFIGIFIVWLIVFFIFNLYNIRRVNPNPQNIGVLITAMLVNTGIAVLAFYLFLGNRVAPKTNLAILATVSTILLIVWRRLFYTLFTNTFKRSIAVVGDSPLMQSLITELAYVPHLGSITKLSPDDVARNVGNFNLLIFENIPPNTLLAFAKAVVSETMTLAEAYELLFGKIPVALMTEERALHIITLRPNPAIRFFYRIFEILIASIVLIATSPFVLIACLAIFLEDGSPVIYRQTRVGKFGSVFQIYKLRTMRKDAEKNGAQWAEVKDDRITRVGRILRKLHIDEIPQMVNIIRGDIALIGPRPERPELVATLEKEIPYYFLRHTTKPGFTGWAQIKFRYARTVLDSQEKFEYDLYYLENRRLLFDIGILLKTVQIIFTH